MVRQYTEKQLIKWSTTKTDLPLVPHVRALHIYDFDNTLFKTPTPNNQLWTGQSGSQLMNESYFTGGGWWHDVRVLEATGEGVDVEEPRAWQGHWNEHIVKLARMSIMDPGIMTVMLTGRREMSHGQLILKMLAAKGLEFNMVCLKPKLGPKNERFDSTMKFKQALLADLIYTYTDATELKIYEDRPAHVRGFREWAEKLNSSIIQYPEHSREKQIATEVIQVPEEVENLDPMTEVKEVQRMINTHNAVAADNPATMKQLTIRRQVFFTGYLLKPRDSQALLELIDVVGRPSAWEKEGEYKFFANNVLILPRPANDATLDKVGGIGRKQMWQVKSIGAFEKDKLYAARVVPVPADSMVHTWSDPPNIVLTCRKGTKTTDVDRILAHAWKSLPQDKQIMFETTVGEKVQLSIEEEGKGGRWGKRKHEEHDSRDSRNDDRRQNGRGRGFKDRGGRGRGGAGAGDARGDDRRARQANDRGRGGGGGARGRGRGGYKSLDDVQDNSRYAMRAQGGRFDGPYDDGGFDQAGPPAYGAMDAMDESGGLKY